MFAPWTRAERLRSITLPDAGSGSAPARSEYGPYRVLEPLGSGGMGVVHRAVHTGTGVEAALKTVRIIDPELFSGLRREVRALSRVEHPGIVRILDVGLTDEPPWYAMELLDGVTMRPLLRALDGTDAPTEAATSAASIEERLGATLPLFAPLCDALAFLHGEGVVHLDLKPDNVFVVDGRPRLMDFGLATRLVAVHGREILDVVGPAVGTLSYMAPEQIDGAPLDARADLYALGCMLYEAICGRPPFVGDNSVAIMVGHLNQAPVPPSERVGQVPPALERLVLSLLEKAPQARPGYAADVASALRDLVGGSPAPGTPTPRDYLYRPRLVGRDAPLEALRAEASRAKSGRARVVIVRGESGIGKTRLAVELARRLADSEIDVLTGRCRPVGPGEGHGGALGPFEEAFHALADRCRERGVVFTERALGSAGPVLSPFAPALRDLPGAEAWPALAPLPARAARARLVSAMTDLLFALADTAPSLLLLDDVHWADDITLAVLGAAASREDGALLVVATCRSEEPDARLDELLAHPDVAVVSLGRLDADGARALAFGMLGHADLPPAMIDRVSEHAEGNPLFIAEYLRAAVREGVLRRVDGRWRADDADGERVASLPLPRSIRDLVDRRVERLSPLAREAVEIAAVLGRDVEAASLAVHLEAPDAALSDALQELVATQMLESLPDGRLKFAHAKLREGVYQRIAPERRAALHVAIAEAIEAGPTGPGRASTLAHHYLAGGAFERALDPLERAGLEALESGSHAAAEAFFLRARTLGAGAIAGVSAVRRARWERGLGDARFALGDLGRAAEHGRAALALLGHALPSSGAGAALAVLRQSVSPLSARRPGHDEAAALTEAALGALRVAEAGYFALDPAALIGGSVLATRLAKRAGTEATAAKAHAMLGLVIGAMRMAGPSARLTARGVELAERGGDGTALAFTLYAKATRDLCYRDFDAARANASRAIDVARGLGDEHDAGVAETILGHCEYFTGALDAAAERYARVARAARACGALQHEAWGLYAEARSLVHLGECARSVALCREALSKLAGQNDAASELICQGLLAWALLGVGDVDGATAAAAIASEHIARSNATIFANIPGYTATCEVWLALARRGHPTAIDRAAAAHRKLASLSLGTPLAETSAALYGGRVALARGDRALARVRLARCLRLAAAHGMRLDEGMAAIALAEAETGEASARAAARGRAILTRIGAPRH